MNYSKIVVLAVASLFVSCVPLPIETEVDGDGEPGAERAAPAWPALESRCVSDAECEVGLFCERLDEEALAAFLDAMPADQIPSATPLQTGETVCRVGCRIDGAFYAPDERGVALHQCLSCQPTTSTTDWSPVATGAVCDDGLYCTAAGGVPGDSDSCDGTGACISDAVNCDDGLFCTGAETCNEEADSCDSSGDPCPGTECNTCQEDANGCFDPIGSVCGDYRGTTCDNPDTCDGTGTCLSNFAPTTIACRPAADVCDVADYCNGRGRCQEDGFKPAGTVCNEGSGDLCDPHEVCTGAEAACPEDSYETVATVCNAGSGDVCDLDEFCPGVPDQGCPEDTVEPSSTLCNEGSGDICDPDEFCTGIADEGCPQDIFEPAITVCKAGSGDVCDPDEFCTGNPDEGCPQDLFEPSTTVCNAGSGDLCDPDEFCTGLAGQGCPADQFEPASTVCNEGSGDVCDPDEVCPGVANQGCPADNVAPATTICRAAAGDCDVDDFCSGVADTACAVDDKKATGFECRPAAGRCDEPEFCNGVNSGCPADAFKPSDSYCRRVGEVFQEDGSSTFIPIPYCDEPEFCTGTGPECPEDVLKPAGTVCRAKGGVCDTDAEVCNGTHKGCSLDVNAWPLEGLVCRAAAGFCDEPEYCDFNNSYPDCPPDQIAPAGTPCKLTPPNPIIQACDVQDYCDGEQTICPQDVRLGEGDTCFLDVGGEGREGTCGPVVFPFFLGLRKCIVTGDSPVGSPCQNNSDCDSLNCAATFEEDIKLCIPADEAGFGQTCDSDGFHLAGDPNGKQCTSTGGDLVCCGGGNLPPDGTTGTCQACCRDNDLPGGLAIGCDGGQNIPKCCGGRCTDAGTDPYNCGGCGESCYDLISPCNPSVISCGSYGGVGFTPGVCRMSFPCGAGQVCQDHCELCWFYDNCDTCVPYATCVTLVVPGSGTLCEDCNTDDDCTGDERCYSGCGGGFADIFCFASNYCATSPDQCTDD